MRGPLVIDHAQTLVGGTVRGGIIIRASHVTLKDVTVIGGENGIDVENAEHVMLDGVHVLGVTLDGIHVRRGSVMVKDCHVSSPRGPVGAGHRHLVRDGQADVDDRGLHDLAACARESSRTG